MNQCVGDVVSGRRFQAPLAEERARYLAHLRSRGWRRSTLIGIAGKLAAFAKRVDIAAEGGVTRAQIEAAADDWMEQSRHRFRRKIGPHKARTKFVGDATRWLRFLRCLREPECSPAPYSNLVSEFTRFLDQERGLSPRTVTMRRIHLLRFLAWFDQQRRPVNDVSVQDVDRFLALPRSHRWSRVTIAGFVDSLRSFFRYAAMRKWCAPNISPTRSMRRGYTCQRGYTLDLPGLRSGN